MSMGSLRPGRRVAMGSDKAEAPHFKGVLGPSKVYFNFCVKLAAKKSIQIICVF